jgi:hypothetical protein
MHAGKVLLFIISMPSVILGYLYVGLCLLLGLSEKFAYEPGLVPTVQWRPWVDKRYRFSLTIGRGISYKPARRDDPTEINTQLERHERKHIWQQEDNCFQSFLLGLPIAIITGDWILGLIIWSSAVVWLSVNFVTAGIRFHDFSIDGMYRNAEHERSAYAQTDLPRSLGKSWEQLREESER